MSQTGKVKLFLGSFQPHLTSIPVDLSKNGFLVCLKYSNGARC